MKITAFFMWVLVPFLLSAQWTDMTREDYGNLIHEMDNKNAQFESISYQAKQVFFKSADGNDTLNVMTFNYLYQQAQGILNIRQFNTFMVQDTLISIRVDSTERMIIIQEPNLELMKLNPSRNFSEFFQSNAHVQKSKIGKETVYKVQFDTLAKYSLMKMWVNSYGEVTKYSLVAGRPMIDSDSEDEQLIYPRMDVLLSPIKKGKEVETLELIKPSFFFTDNTFSTLNKEFEDFEIWDTRQTNK